MLLLIFLVYAAALSTALGLKGIRAGGRRQAGGTIPPDSNAMRVLIVGATGGTGRQLVAQALDRGFHVTAFVRNPSAIRLEHPRLRVVRGDVLDPLSLAEAVRGQHAVISALGHRRFFAPTRILSDGTRNLLLEMKTCGVKRFVCETALGLGDTAGRMGLYYTLFVIPAVLPFYFWDKARQERLIAESDAHWVIVRPSALTDAAPRGRYHHGAGIGSFVTTRRIARADVAAFMLNQLSDDTYLRSAPGVSW
jgi:putative NADH-flavin reductase